MIINLNERIDNIHKNNEYLVGHSETDIKNIHIKVMAVVSFFHQTFDYHSSKKITDVLLSGSKLQEVKDFTGVSGVIDKFTNYQKSETFYKNIMPAIRRNPLFAKMSDSEIKKNIQEVLPEVKQTLDWAASIAQIK